MNCDLCGNQIINNRAQIDCYSIRADTVIGKLTSRNNICEGCFMSFEYWKDSRKKNDVEKDRRRKEMIQNYLDMGMSEKSLSRMLCKKILNGEKID